MVFDNSQVVTRNESVLSVNRVLRNTYLLLSLTLLFSAGMAGIAMLNNAPPLNPWLTLGGYFLLLMLTSWLRNSVWGIISVFALTGFLGYTLGPILNLYVNTIGNGQQIVLMSLGATGVIFLALSAYALTTRKDFSFMASFLMVGMVVAFLASLGGLLFHIPGLMLAVSAMFVILSSGVILLQTGQIISGGERNYVMATVTLYVSLYNIFLSLLNLLSAFNSRD